MFEDFLLALALASAFAGGVIFGLWPKPRLVKRFRVGGLVLGALALVASGILVYRFNGIPYSAQATIFLDLFGTCLFLWFVSAVVVDFLKGSHAFSRDYDLWTGKVRFKR